MNVTDLLLIPPFQLATLTDAELATKLEPLIPSSRAAYIGPRTATVLVGAARVSKSAYAKKMAMMDAVLASLKAQQT